MTPQQKSQLNVLLWTVLAGLILLTAPKAAEQVVLRPEYQQHLIEETGKLRSILILQCRVTPDDTICKDYR
jgi:hypothetical protein